MSSALTETNTRGQPDRPLKVCDALGPSGRDLLLTLFLETCGGRSAMKVGEREGRFSAVRRRRAKRACREDGFRENAATMQHEKMPWISYPTAALLLKPRKDLFSLSGRPRAPLEGGDQAAGGLPPVLAFSPVVHC